MNQTSIALRMSKVILLMQFWHAIEELVAQRLRPTPYSFAYQPT